MLPKEKRLNLKKDFKWLASGKRIETKFLKLFLRIGDNQTPRIGITTSSKIFRRATQRNRARRLTSAAFESLYTYLPPAINIIALPKAGVLDVKSGDVLLDVEGVLKEAHVIEDRH